MTVLLLKRASVSRPSGKWNERVLERITSLASSPRLETMFV
jgi:hypothetical protein